MASFSSSLKAVRASFNSRSLVIGGFIVLKECSPLFSDGGSVLLLFSKLCAPNNRAIDFKPVAWLEFSVFLVLFPRLLLFISKFALIIIFSLLLLLFSTSLLLLLLYLVQSLSLAPFVVVTFLPLDFESRLALEFVLARPPSCLLLFEPAKPSPLLLLLLLSFC